MTPEELKRRTKAFAVQVIRFAEGLPRGRSVDIIARQLVKAGTSVGANYRAACRGRSRADFKSKIGITLEEADETLYWLEILTEAATVNRESVTNLMKEANELVAIFTANAKTPKQPG